jgi:hypothetical protein
MVKILASGADEAVGTNLLVKPPHRLVPTWTAGAKGVDDSRRPRSSRES